MKKIKNSIVIILLLAFISCTDTYEVHKEYANDGEIVYAPKVESLKVLPGNNRVKIAGLLTRGFTVKEIIVYWNKREKSKTFSYTKSENEVDNLELIIDGLEEKTYEFEIYTKDQEGNSSIKSNVFGTVYGENFRSNLDARAFKSFALDTDTNEAVVNFKLSDEYTRATEIKYTNKSGAEVVKLVNQNEENIVLDELDIDKPIMYRTMYVPTSKDGSGNETSIDEFGSDWSTYAVPEIITVLDNLNSTPILEGVTIDWKNTKEKQINLDFKILSNGIEVTRSTQSKLAEDSFDVRGTDTAEESIKVTVSDPYKNSFSKTITVASIAPVKFARDTWEISNFSSEEPIEAYWSSYDYQGKALSVLDGILDTFWHTQWYQAKPEYPHNFTVDMKEEKTVSSFKVFRRQGKGDGASKHEFFVSTDNSNWVKVGEYNGKFPSDDGVKISLAQPITARYAKYVAVEGPRFYTHLSEFEVFGSNN